MTGDKGDIPPAVKQAAADLAADDIPFMRPTADGGVERVSVNQMTEEEHMLALAILHHRRTRKMT